VADFSSPTEPVQLHANWVGHQQPFSGSSSSFQPARPMQERALLQTAPAQIDLRLDSLSLLTNREPVLDLRQPVQICSGRLAPVAPVGDSVLLPIELSGRPVNFGLLLGSMAPRRGPHLFDRSSFLKRVLQFPCKLGPLDMAVFRHPQTGPDGAAIYCKETGEQRLRKPRSIERWRSRLGANRASSSPKLTGRSLTLLEKH